MATEVSNVPSVSAPIRPGRRRGDGGSTFAMVAPAIGLLAVFFILPLYYIFLFSVGLRHFARTEKLASVNGEQTSIHDLDLEEVPRSPGRPRGARHVISLSR